jgi:hypothetical protein
MISFFDFLENRTIVLSVNTIVQDLTNRGQKFSHVVRFLDESFCSTRNGANIRNTPT